MPNNEEQIMGLYWIGLPNPKPIKNVTNSSTSKDRLIKSNKLLAEDL